VPNTDTKGFPLLSGLGVSGFVGLFTVFRKIISLRGSILAKKSGVFTWWLI
jgi:hypothetical protein